MCWNTSFYSVFWTYSKSCPKIGPPKIDNFKFRKNILLQPPTSAKIGAFELLFFWKGKNIDVDQKNNLR